MDKPIEEWTADDFKAEAKRVLQDDREESEDILCGAMMLMALRDGPKLSVLAKNLGVKTSVISNWFHNLQANRVFRKDGKVSCSWMDEGSGGIAFCADVAVAQGLLARN